MNFYSPWNHQKTKGFLEVKLIVEVKFGDDPLQKLSNTYDGTFFKHSKWLQAVNHFRKTFIFAKIFAGIQNTSLLCIRQIHAQSQQIQGPSTTFIRNLYICTCSKVFYRTSCSEIFTKLSEKHPLWIPLLY